MPARDDGRFRLHARLRRKFHDGFLADDDDSRIDSFDFSDERLSGIMRELEADRDRITRILAVLEHERTKRQKR